MTFILRPIWLEADLNWGRFDWGRFDWSRFDLGPIWLEILNFIVWNSFSDIMSHMYSPRHTNVSENGIFKGLILFIRLVYKHP